MYFSRRAAALSAPIWTATASCPPNLLPPSSRWRFARPGQEVDWGNQVTIWNVSLATDVADPVDRLERIAANTRAARGVHAERDLWLFGDWMDYWPLFWFYGRGLPLLGARTRRRPTYSMTVSNVPGPKKQLYFAGAPIENIISVGPIIYPYGLNVTGWSYLDNMTIGMQACKKSVADFRRSPTASHKPSPNSPFWQPIDA